MPSTRGSPPSSRSTPSLANPKPLTIAAVQALLKADEALVLFLDVPRLGKLPEETLAWVVTKTTRAGSASRSAPRRSASVWRRCAAGSIAKACGPGPASTSAGKPTVRACQRAARPTASPSTTPLPFDLGTAHELYQVLLAPFADLTSGKSLIIVPSGPLTSLPFHVLVTAPSPRLRRDERVSGRSKLHRRRKRCP